MFHLSRQGRSLARTSQPQRQQRLLLVAKSSRRNNFSSSTTKSKKDGQQVRRSTTAAQAEEGEEAESLFSQFRTWYSEKLETHPLITKSITGGLIAACGDTVCQFGTYSPEEHKAKLKKQMEKKKQKQKGNNKTKDSDEDFDDDFTEISFWKEVYEPKRSMHFYLMGAFFAAPLNHFWFNWISKNIPGQSLVQISKRVGLDQLLWCPAWTVAWLGVFWSLEGMDHKDIPKGLQENYYDIITANWVLWIPAQYINFYFVPLKYQVLFTNAGELIWNTFLSFAAGNHGIEDMSTDDDDEEDGDSEEKERELKRQATVKLHRRRTFR